MTAWRTNRQRRPGTSSHATPEEVRAYEWKRRRWELLGRERGSIENAAAALGLSVRTLQRYEFDGAPAWYELALIGLAHSTRRQP